MFFMMLFSGHGLASGFSLPHQDSVVAMQQNLSLICEVYVPHGTPPGIQEGKVTLQAGGDVLEIDVALEVWDFTLPDKLSFVPGRPDIRAAVPELLRQITGKRARESVIQRFSMANMAAGYADVWRRVAGK